VSRCVPPVLLVAAGGVAGSLARAAAGVALPHEPGTWGWATLVVNALGAAALCALLVQVPSPQTRLLLGTGLLGGFTTFSGFTVDAVLLLAAGRPGGAAGYVLVSLGTLLVGGLTGHRLGQALRG
jgi:CrcB protein